MRERFSRLLRVSRLLRFSRLLRACRLLRLLPAFGLALAMTAHAARAEVATAAADPRLEARMIALATELRCLVCQNQTVAESHAGLAQDLRQQIRDMLAKGMDERQIREHMSARYGDFVLYRPPFKARTALLWLAPALLLLATVGGLLAELRRRQRMSADAFDPEGPDDEPAPGTGSTT